MYIVFIYEYKFKVNLLFFLQYVVFNIVEYEIRYKEILQSSFDLFGELIKFNVEVFKIFEEIFYI